jgi:hypothetical protein
LEINNKRRCNNDGDHGVEEKAGKKSLKSGFYPIEVKFNLTVGEAILLLSTTKQILPQQF